MSVIPLKHKTETKLGLWPHACNFSTHEAGAGGPQSGLGQLVLHINFYVKLTE